MTDLKLQLKISTDGAGAAQVEIDRLSGSVARLGPNARAAAGGTSELSNAMTALKGVIGGLGLAALAREYAAVAVQQDKLRASAEAATGSIIAGRAALEFAADTANRYGLEIVSTANAYIKLSAASRGTALEGQATARIFDAIAKASASLGLSADETSGALLAIGQMMSKGKVSAEELRGQLGERLPGAFQAMATAMGVTTAELDKLLADGKVGIDVLPRFAAEIDKTYSGGRFDNAASEINRLNNAWTELKANLTNSEWVSDIARGLTERLQLLADLADRLGVGRSGNGAAYGPEVWQYMDDTRRKIDGAMAGRGTMRGAPAGGGDGGFVGPQISDDELKARRTAVEKAEQAARAAAAKSAREQEAANRTLLQSKIELLKAQGKLAEALFLEAKMRGLSGDQAREYVRTEMATVQAKEQAAEATRRETEATRARADAQRILLDLIKETENPWDKYQRQVQDVETAMKSVSLSTEEYARLSQAMTDNLNREREAFGQSEAAMAGHVELYRQQQERQAAVIERLREEAETVNMAADAREVYLALKEAGVAADSREGQQIAGLVRYYQDLRQEQEGLADNAARYEQLWIQALRNIQTAAGDLFAAMANGEATSLDTMMRSMQRAGAQYAGNVAALAAQQAYQQFKTGGSGNVEWGRLASAMGPVVAGAVAAALMPRMKIVEGQPDWMRNSMIELHDTLAGGLADIVGNLGGWFSLLKLVTPMIEFDNRLGRSLYPDRRPSGTGLAIGLATGFPLPHMLASLFGEVVKSGLGIDYSTARGASVGGRYSQNGAPIGWLDAAGGSLGPALDSLSRSLGIDIPYLTASYQNRGAKMNITGYGAGGQEFYRSSDFKITDINLEGQQKLFITAILKRQEVLRQFDDFLIRGAYSAANSLEEIRANLKGVAKIRALEGQIGSNAGELGALWNTYSSGADLIGRITSGRRRRREMAGLDSALGVQFERQIFDFQRSMDAFTGSNANDLQAALRDVGITLADIRAQDQALRDFAKRSKGKVSYTGLTAEEFAAAEAEAVKRTVQAYFDSATAGIEAAMLTVKASIQSILDDIAGGPATIARLTGEIGAGLSALSVEFDPEAAGAKAQEITALVLQRYELEAQAIRDQIAAAENLRGIVDGLRTGDLSALSWMDQFNLTRSRYESAARAVQGGDRSAETLNTLGTTAQDYLSFAKQGYGTLSDQYRSIFGPVTAMLEQAGQAPNETAELQDLQKRTVDLLQQVQASMDRAAAAAEQTAASTVASITATQRAAGDIVTGLGVYLGGDSPVVNKLDRIRVNTGNTAVALK